MEASRHEARPGLREVWAMWGLYSLVVAAVFATYSRLPVQDLYHVSLTGRTGGLSRALVVLNFPTALVAIALVTIVAARARTRMIGALAVGSVLLCAVVAVPGVVDQVDLDAKWSNALPAAGVALALALTVYVTWRDGLGPPLRFRRDGLRLAAIALIVLVSIPWIGTELGLLVGRWPILGSIFYSDEWFAPFGHARLHRAVHEGHHHGIDGALLATTAIILSRTLPQLGTALRRTLSAYLALMLVYGLANLAQDFWYEQLVKSGLTGVQIPSLLVPAPTWAWLIAVVVAAIVDVAVFRRVEASSPAQRTSSVWPVAAVGAVIALALVGLAAPAERHVTPFRSVEGIAYAYAPDSRSHIFLTRRGEDLQLTDSDGSELAPEWSRDGDLAFQSNREHDWELYVRQSDGSVVQVTDNEDADGEPAWSPDAARIALVRDGDAYVVALRGTRQRALAADVNWPAWSVHGFFAFETGTHPLRRLAGFVDPRHRMPDEGLAEFRYPAWSPDSRRLAHGCRVDDRWQICIWDRAGGLLDVITEGDANNFAPAWSPDGSRIAFVSDRDGNDQVFVMRSNGSDVVRVTAGQGDKDTPAWRP